MKDYRFYIIVLALLIALMPVAAFASDVSNALWRGKIQVTNNGTATENVSTVVSINSTALIANGYVESDLTDVVIQYNGADVSFMPGYDGALWSLFVDNAPVGTIDYDLYTGNATGEIKYFPNSSGMTIDDDPSMEITDNGTSVLDAYIDTSTSGNLTSKGPAFNVSTDASGNVTAKIGVAYEVNDDADSAIHSTEWRAQTFTTDATGTATVVRLRLLKVLGSPGTITVSIRATTAGLPTGADLTSGTINGNDLTTDAGGAFYEVGLTPYELSAGVYAVVVRAPSGDAANYFSWRGDITSPTFTGGSRIDSTDSGASWAADTAKDYMFAVYGVSQATVTASGVSAGEHTKETAIDSPFFSVGIDADSPVTPVTEDLLFNAPLWQSDEGTNPFTTIDSNAYSGNVTGATWILDSGYSFDGDDDYILFSGLQSVSLTPFTAQFWVKMNTLTTAEAYHMLYEKHSGAITGNDFAVMADGTLRLYSSNGSQTSIISTDTIAAGEWHNIAIQNDGTTSWIYLDGELSKTGAGATTPNTTTILTLGDRGDRYGSANCILGQYLLYDSILDISEITQNYNATKGKYASGDISTYSTLASVPDTDDDWVVGSDATPFINSYKHYVDGTLVSDISWEYSSTFTDASGNGNDATPTFRTSSSDADVSATFTSLLPVSQSQPDTFTLTSIYSILTGTPDTPDNMFTDSDYSKLPAEPINEILDDASIPRAAWWFPFLFFGIAIVGMITYGATSATLGVNGKIVQGKLDGSLLLMFFVMEGLLVVFGKMGPIPYWPAYLFPLPAIALILSKKHFTWG